MSSGKLIKIIKREAIQRPLFFLSLKNINLAYEDKPIFADMNLEVGYNRLLLIKGAVGSGKSSLLKLLAGVIKFSGDISNKNSEGVQLSPIYIHSQYEFNFLTGYIKDEALLSDVPLESIDKQYHDRSIYNLSGGELKRISINLAIAQPNFNLLLLDEPLDMLDDSWHQKIAREILGSLGKKVFIIATHDDIFDRHADTILEIV